MTADGRLQVARVLAVGGVAVTVIGTLLPWLRSGERARSSYELAGLAGRLLDGTTATVAHAWLVYPLVATGVIAALFLHSGRVVLIGAALVATCAAVFALAVARAPLPGLVGLWVTCAGAVIVLPALALVMIAPVRPSAPPVSLVATLEHT